MADRSDLSFLDDLDLDDARISFAETDRARYGTDFGTDRTEPSPPDVVVTPHSTAEVSAVLSTATAHGVPVTPYAAGTGLEGHAVPVHGGITLDMSAMDEIRAVYPADRQITVGPGITGGAVDEVVADEGLFLPPLPQSGDEATIGGMVATDASGIYTVKYGEVSDWVLALTAVRADGTVIETGSRARKTSSGYNLTDLLVGSEGTLAVITEVTLRLAKRPAAVRGGRAVFGSLSGAVEAIAEVLHEGIDVAAIELLDARSVRMVNDYLGTELPDAPMVFFECHGETETVGATVERCRDAFESGDCTRIEVADDAATLADLWRIRSELGRAERAYDPDLDPIHPGDVTVPIGSYPDLVSEVDRLSRESGLFMPCFGHAGDGNLHYTVMVDRDDPAQRERGERLYRRVVERAIELGGTATGEHGIGLGKQAYLTREHGEDAVETMRMVKRALDPTDTLNPGKMFPETVDGGRIDTADE
ncbi:FAD-binding oxidoreductase [Halorubrum vacuolatum]|uniref:D-lactate dehydrogenase (cytochrome) n=1 Tax=Halorubrum vacuolatum TaxID=63740 RepID=A0A238W7W5_HALVU|nr:FAD-binding oxidoreductase [Halorubrum vacuolatum]SNR42666.1 D-lactate dehydrogenase (cytochrome) [Halorubrum vacuolatum]